MTRDSEEKDLEAARAGDEEAYLRIIRRYQDAVSARMWRFTRNRGDLEMLVHDVFVEAWLSLDRYRGDAPFSHWLSRIATHRGYAYWREQRRGAKILPLEEAQLVATKASPEGAIQTRETCDRLFVLLERLSPEDRLVLTLHYYDGMDAAAIAKETGWNRVAVRMRLSRARRRLYALAKAEGGWEEFE